MYEVPFQDIWKRVLAIVYIINKLRNLSTLKIPCHPKNQVWLSLYTTIWSGILFQAAHIASHCCFLQKLHWASKETYDFFIATLTKIQSINRTHNWAHISYNTSYQAHLKKNVCSSKNGVNCSESQEVSFQKSQKWLASRARSLARTKASMAVT